MSASSPPDACNRRHYPLSQAQRRIWIEHRLNPNTLFYNISHVYLMRGELQPDLLEQSIQAVVQRHEILRTNYLELDLSPVQVIREASATILTRFDLRGHTEEVRAEFEARIIAQELERPFDLEADRLIRGVLLQMRDDCWLLVLVIHHIASDRWSMDIFYHELSVYYNAYVTGEMPQQFSLPIQYKDYAAAEHESYTAMQQHADESYWLRELDDELPLLNLLGGPRPLGALSSASEIVEAELDLAVLKRLKEIASTTQSTLFMLLLAAFSAFLLRVSSQRSFVIGTYFANRQRSELLHLIGILFNNLPIRIDVDPEGSFEELLRQVKGKLLGAFAHPNFSFDRIIAARPGARIGGYQALYNVTFQFYHQRKYDFTLRGVKITRHRVVKETLHDLMGYAQETEHGLRLWFNYRVQLFDRATISGLLECFQEILNSVAYSPNQMVRKLNILALAQREQLLYSLNDSMIPYPNDTTIAKLIEEQAARSPKQLAVLSTGDVGSATLDYAALNRKASAVGWALQNQGLRSGEVVGVLLERSADLVSAYFGILKAGCICLPLDPRLPRERLRYMAKDANVKAILTTSTVHVRKLIQKHIPNIDLQDLGEHEVDLTAVDVPAASPAFIIYTSGSTGKPKGVVLTHQGLINGIMHRIRILRITANDTLCLSLSLGFVTLPLQLFVPLFAGAALVVYPEDVVRDPRLLFAQVQQTGVGAVEITPSALQTYCSWISDNPERKLPLAKLRAVLVAGEKLKAPVAAAMLDHYQHLELINAYGQTECSGMTLSCVVRRDGRLDRIVEGCPSQNHQVYILDQDQAPVPLGVPGEIYISGAGLALGYLNKPQRTKEVFLPHPFAPGQRIFRSGDLGRRVADGSVEVLGRLDDQIKIRGYRIHPGEIEQLLLRVRGVKACCVLAHSTPPGDPMLVAYYAADGQISSQILRAQLRVSLPNYMLPAQFVWLRQMPLNANGKVDRKSLPPPTRITSTAMPVDLSPLERVVRDAWAEALRISEIGLDEDFFELGGHSLQAIQIAARLNAHFGVETAPNIVFEYSTIKTLAAALAPILPSME